MTQALARDRKGEVFADWRYTNWMRRWMEDDAMWDMLDSLSDVQLEYLRLFLRSVVYKPDGTPVRPDERAGEGLVR